jgi:hypothetical protein
VEEWISVRGTLTQGYGVASGPSADYPYGALERQSPIFRERGLDLTGCFLGTLNIDIRPMEFRLVKPEFVFCRVCWTDLHPPEDFSFSRCNVVFDDTLYPGWIYFPHPETKKRNFQSPSLLEVIAPWIPNIKAGDRLDVQMNKKRIALTRAGDQ